MDWKAIQKLCVTIIFALYIYILIEHQEKIMKNTLNNVMINDIYVCYWTCTTIK